MVETNLVFFFLVDVLFIICPTYNYGCGKVGSLSNTLSPDVFFISVISLKFLVVREL